MNDDAYILRVSRTLAARNEKIRFRETEVMADGAFKITVAILPMEADPPWEEITDRTATTTVLLHGHIAHGRRLALEKAMTVEIENDAAGGSS